MHTNLQQVLRVKGRNSLKMACNESGVRPILPILVCTLFLGCNSSPQDSGLVKVSGVIHVDGQPANGVVLTLHPDTNDQPSSVGAVSTGVTGSTGSFEISTYRSGDGALPGSYNVTCVWSKFDPISRSMLGDKLSGRYASPKKPAAKWLISKSESKDVGTIDLKTK